MPHPERYEVFVLGSGAGGKLLAWHMARSGRRTAVAERKWLGGSCPNIIIRAHPTVAEGLNALFAAVPS